MIEQQLYNDHLKLLKSDLIQMGIPPDNIILLNVESLAYDEIKNYKDLYITGSNANLLSSELALI